MLKPLDNRVLVDPIVEKEKKYGSLVVTNMSEEQPTLGIVKAVGPRVKTVVVGDTAVYGRYAGTTITIGFADYLLVSEDDILGTWEDDK